MSLHEEKKEVLAQIRRMREWVMEVEHIFDGSWASQEEEISNAEVGWRLDDWLVRLSTFLQADERTEDERVRLDHLLKVRIAPTVSDVGHGRAVQTVEILPVYVPYAFKVTPDFCPKGLGATRAWCKEGRTR